jgi:hypothetical protein
MQRHARTLPPEGVSGDPAYTPRVRRWVCIVTLLAGFGGQGYVWHVRLRRPVAIERTLESYRGRDGLDSMAAWWLRA